MGGRRRTLRIPCGWLKPSATGLPCRGRPFHVPSLWVEPLPADHPFRAPDNVLATPHLGYLTEGLYQTFYGDTVRNIVDWLDRRDPRLRTRSA